MLLTILIPTYNRANYLQKNLNELIEIIPAKYANEICIIISNNCSSDNTIEVVNKAKSNSHISINLFTQKENIGLEKNALFVLEKATAEYVMYLGDDDYISKHYFEKIYYLIKNVLEVSCILPSIQAINSEGKIIEGRGRNLNEPNQEFVGGFDSAIKNFAYGHQLSGVVLKREGLLEAYVKANLQNIYPFMFFVGYNCLRGNLHHIKSDPIKVTVVDQVKKDWNYGRDGLFNERYRNSKALFRKTLVNRILAEQSLAKGYLSNFENYLNKGFLNLFYFILGQIKGTDSTIYLKFTFLFYYLPYFFLRTFYRKLKTLFVK